MDHLIVHREDLKRARDCGHTVPLLDSDHEAIKLMLRLCWSMPTKPKDVRMEAVRRDRSALTCANVEARRVSQRRFAGMVKAALGEARLTRAARVGSAVTTAFGNGVLTEVRADGVRIVALQPELWSYSKPETHGFDGWQQGVRADGRDAVTVAVHQRVVGADGDANEGHDERSLLAHCGRRV
jgi:hypothetical protein